MKRKTQVKFNAGAFRVSVLGKGFGGLVTQTISLGLAISKLLQASRSYPHPLWPSKRRG